MPERIIQFGEGNFLRAFADWMVDILNERGLFNGRIAIVHPRPTGNVTALNQQDGLYTVLLRGTDNGKVIESRRLVTAVSRGLNPYEQWRDTVACFCQPTIRFVISNTTEAGIVHLDEPPGPCPKSFPAKVAALLHERFRTGADGLIFLPCELIDRNGDNLRRIVLQHAAAWKLGDDFIVWLRDKNFFLNTLVDRIVPGFPAAEADQLRAELGYDDQLLVAGEHFHLWVIEGPAKLADEIPFHRAGLNVVWTDNLEPYRTRKVRILNGAHTASVLAAHLAGLKTVGDMMNDPGFSRWIRDLVFDEILPTVPLPEKEKRAYAETVLERFKNPFIRHELLSIALNSVSKWKTRCLPTLLDYHKTTGTIPEHLAYSLAALIAFYRDGQHARDDASVLQFFRDRRDSPTLVADTLANTAFWGQDLTKIPGLLAAASVPVLLRLHQRDNVAVVTCTGHKVATADIAAGTDIIKYGQPIGVATADIAAGQPVHAHNLRTKLAGVETYSYTPVGSEWAERLATLRAASPTTEIVGVPPVTHQNREPVVGRLCESANSPTKPPLRRSGLQRRQLQMELPEAPRWCSAVCPSLRRGEMLIQPAAGGECGFQVGSGGSPGWLRQRIARRLDLMRDIGDLGARGSDHRSMTFSGDLVLAHA